MSNQETQELMYEDEARTIHHIEMGEALARLKKNPDFQKIVLDGYLKEKVLASVSLMAVPSQRGNRPEIIEDINSASSLQFYFMQIEHFHQSSVQDEEMEEEMRLAEEGDS